MKCLLSVAVALSLIFTVSAQQCNTNAVLSCTQNYANMLNGVTDPAEAQRITREFCQSTCVTTTLPACSSLAPSVQVAVDQLMQACSLLNGAPSVSTASSVIALLSSIIMAGFAAVFF